MDYFNQHKIIHDEYSEKAKAHHEEFACEHKYSNLTKRKIKGGSFQYIMQCATCGYPASQAISKSKAIESNGGIEPDLFDNEHYESYQEAKKDHWDELHSDYQDKKSQLEKIFGIQDLKQDQEKFFAVYNKHLKTDKWKNTREKVLKRASYICEGCLDSKAVEVHHLSYANVGDELLFQLVALCESCHEKCHT